MAQLSRDMMGAGEITHENGQIVWTRHKLPKGTEDEHKKDADCWCHPHSQEEFDYERDLVRRVIHHKSIKDLVTK